MKVPLVEPKSDLESSGANIFSECALLVSLKCGFYPKTDQNAREKTGMVGRAAASGRRAGREEGRLSRESHSGSVHSKDISVPFCPDKIRFVRTLEEMDKMDKMAEMEKIGQN